jgi:hypothetical protein
MKKNPPKLPKLERKKNEGTLSAFWAFPVAA